MTRATLLTVAVLLGSLLPLEGLATRARLQVSAHVVRSARVELRAHQPDGRSLQVVAAGPVAVEQRSAEGREALVRDARTGAWQLRPDTTAVVVTVMADAR